VLDESELSRSAFRNGDRTLAAKVGLLNRASRFRMVPFVVEDFSLTADWILRQQE